MLLFIDYNKKNAFIMAPKCGTTTIATYLNKYIDSNDDYYQIHTLDDSFLKLIIYREDIISRFLSGFYEDLLNSKCYDEMNITFDEYLSFLNYCYINKIPNVNNINCYYEHMDIPVWFGKCDKMRLPITNCEGVFCSHIMTQKYAIYNIVERVLNQKNIQLVELNDIHKVIKDDTVYNKKQKSIYTNVSEMKLCDMKRNNIIISKACLEEKHVKIILNMYKEDIEFIQHLKKKYTLFTD
jgi:hypothetical protein